MCPCAQPDWWFVGGRIFPGETPARSCCRLLKRELGLEIDPKRLQPVCCQSLAWGMREQLPKDHGTTDSQVVLSLVLTEEEVGKVVLDPAEYETSQWVEPQTVLDGDFHPALQFAVRALLGKNKMDELAQAVAAHPDNDVEVARLARELVALTKSCTVREGTSEYRVVAPALQCDQTVASQLA